MKKQVITTGLLVGSLVLGGAGATAASAKVVTAPASSAAGVKGPNKATGAIDCQGGSIRIKEIHTITNTKGRVTAQIYGAISTTTPWEHTSSLNLGYSAAFANWNGHHPWHVKSKGGKVFAADVKVARVDCS